MRDPQRDRYGWREEMFAKVMQELLCEQVFREFHKAVAAELNFDTAHINKVLGTRTITVDEVRWIVDGIWYRERDGAGQDKPVYQYRSWAESFYEWYVDSSDGWKTFAGKALDSILSKRFEEQRSS